MSPVLLAVGVVAIGVALLVLAFVVLPAGPSRVPLSRLDPTAAPTSSSALAGAGAVAGSAVDVVVQLTRLRDGTRRVTHVTEVQGMEGETVTLQDAFLFDYSAGVDTAGKFLGKPVPTGVRPRFTDRFEELGIKLSPRVFGAGETVRSWA
jgi:hypothetical protein